MTISKNRNFGVVGEVSCVHKEGYYDNTPPFVRLYEGLSEYIEESRNGSDQSYFTRAFKAAPPQMRDLGIDGNNNYFNNSAPASLSGMVREPARPAWNTMEPPLVPAWARVSHGILIFRGLMETHVVNGLVGLAIPVHSHGPISINKGCGHPFASG